LRIAFLLAISIFHLSCSSIHRTAIKKIFKVKQISMDNTKSFIKIPYYTSKGDGFSCFENDNGQETITVDSNYTKYAIDHFYKRNLLVSIKVTRTPSYTDPTMAYLKENVDFELEQTGCIIKDFNGLREHYYVSFRKVKD